MSSAKAPACIFSIIFFFGLLTISPITTPQTLWAESAQNIHDGSLNASYTKDHEGADQTDEDSLRTVICHGEAGDSKAGLFCAAEIRLGGRYPLEIGGDASQPDTLTFVLKTHETVVLRTRGELDTHGQLFDANGARLAANDDGGDGHNFRIVKTLPPGRFYLTVAGPAGAQGSFVLHTARARPLGWIGARPVDPTRDVGNHCGRAAAISAPGTVEGRFERPGDIDVFALELPAAGDLLISIDGAVRFELKAADCATSLGLASSALGATLALLDAGSYFLYVSRPTGSPDRYDIRLDLR